MAFREPIGVRVSNHQMVHYVSQGLHSIDYWMEQHFALFSDSQTSLHEFS